MFDNEQAVRLSHPVFTVFACQLFSVESVDLITPRKTQSLKLVIASPGIVFLKPRKWMTGFHNHAIIPYFQITKISVDSHSTTISYGTRDPIRFTQQRHLKLAADISANRCTLFDPMDIPYELEIHPDVASAFNGLARTSNITDTLVHRFLAYALLLQLSITSAQLNVVVSCLTRIRKTLKLDSDILRLPASLRNEVAAAFKHDRHITELIFQSLPFHEGLQFVTPLLSSPNVVARICFVEVTFEGDYREFTEKMSNQNVQVTEWIFERCHLETSQSKSLFDGFLRYKTSVRYLAFNGCTFSPDVASYVFGDAFFFSKAFHQLEVLWLKYIHLPEIGRAHV
jgi:hypothetical protein